MSDDIQKALKKKGYTEEQITKALGSLEKEEVSKEKRKEYSQKKRQDPSFMEKQRKMHQKRNAKTKLLVQKALEAGLTVTDQEVESYLKK